MFINSYVTLYVKSSDPENSRFSDVTGHECYRPTGSDLTMAIHENVIIPSSDIQNRDSRSVARYIDM